MSSETCAVAFLINSRCWSCYRSGDPALRHLDINPTLSSVQRLPIMFYSQCWCLDPPEPTAKHSVLHPMHTEPGDPHRSPQPRITGSSFTSPPDICPLSSTWTVVNHPVSSLACSYVFNAQCSCGYVQKRVLKHACVCAGAFVCGCIYTVHMDMCAGM